MKGQDESAAPSGDGVAQQQASSLPSPCHGTRPLDTGSAVTKTASPDGAAPPQLQALAVRAALHDGQTPNHLFRMQHYMAALARQLRRHPRFTTALTDDYIALLSQATLLHDVGKAEVPAAILHKPGKLTAAEFDIVKLHTVHGRAAIDAAAPSFGTDQALLHLAREIAYSHHEKYDGSGYPAGLAGDAIPLPARLLAVADVYDALISRRAYKPPFTHETAVELIRQGAGDHFDPDAVDAMLAVEEEFLAIARRFGDADQATVQEDRAD